MAEWGAGAQEDIYTTWCLAYQVCNIAEKGLRLSQVLNLWHHAPQSSESLMTVGCADSCRNQDGLDKAIWSNNEKKKLFLKFPKIQSYVRDGLMLLGQLIGSQQISTSLMTLCECGIDGLSCLQPGSWVSLIKYGCFKLIIDGEMSSLKIINFKLVEGMIPIHSKNILNE